MFSYPTSINYLVQVCRSLKLKSAEHEFYHTISYKPARDVVIVLSSEINIVPSKNL